MSLKRSRDDAKDIAASTDVQQFESSPIDDRASRFVALFSPVIAPKTLQAHPPYKTASHRILAWRRQSRQQTLNPVSSSRNSKVIYDTGSDDDGEKYAGKKLEKLLNDMNVVGSLVVARWYGGVLLGPVRFDHIVNVAKEAIGKWQESMSGEAAAKKPRVEPLPQMTAEQEAEQKQKLVKVLEDRDISTAVLRKLLAEKKAKATEPTGTAVSQGGSPQKPPPTPDYSKMPLATLKKLETAKDNTIAWILKQMDDLEASSADRKHNAGEG